MNRGYRYHLDSASFQGKDSLFWLDIDDKFEESLFNLKMDIQNKNNIDMDINDIEPIIEINPDIVDAVEPDYDDPFETDGLSQETVRRISIETKSPKILGSLGMFKDSES